MDKNILVDKIMNFCITYKLLKKTAATNQIENIEKQLNNVVFIENLINTIFICAKKRRKLDDEKIIDLLIELERLRLKLEDKESTK